MLLLEKGLYYVQGSVDPETVLWENLGTPFRKKVGRNCLSVVVIIMVLAVSYFGLLGIKSFEALHNQFVKSDCSGNEYYSIQNAYDDFLLPTNKQ